MRFEISNVDEKTVEKIKVWCVKNKKTHGIWAKEAHESLTKKQ